MGRRWMMLGCCLLLAACASAPPLPAVPPALLHDGDFAAPSHRPDPAEVFALDDAMRRYLVQDIGPRVRREGAKQALVTALRERGALRLDYDATMTRNAREAFQARSGNCLSLVIMTAAFAKAMDLSVTFQSAVLEETWSRSGNLYFASGHVNVTLAPRMTDFGNAYDAAHYMTIDFLPEDELRGLRTRPVDESTIIAMYMNNRAAESLVAGEVDDAYWWAREALRQRSDFLPAYNTLGVVYLQRSMPAAAESAFTHVLQHGPDNAQALANLASALKAQGRNAEAEAVQKRLARVEPVPPFRDFRLGLAAMRAGQVAAARDLFAKEVDRAPYYHEFQFWLGVAEFRLGHAEQARKHLELAMENSTTRSDRDLYAAKLDRLKATQLH